MRPNTLLRAAIAALSIVAAAPAVATSTGVVVAPGVVVDPTTSTAFVMAPERRVVAIDTTLGASRWTSDAASVPLHVVGGAVIASGEGADTAQTLDILSLDAATGTVGTATQVDLPRALHTHVDQSLGKAFDTQVTLDGGDIVLAWKAYVSDIRGVGPKFDPEALIQPRAQKVQAGRVERLGGEVALDLDAGTWRPLTTEKSAHFQRRRAIDAGKGIVLIGDERLPGIDGHQYLSADGRHVLASERLDGLVWRWRILDRAGELIATFDRPQARTPFVVVDDTVLSVTTASASRDANGTPTFRGPQLVGLDTNGGERFTVALRDTTFRGPFPH